MSDLLKNRISIIIPTYNRGKYLRETIQSALSQTYQDYEIIVVDDGSTDNTAEIVKQLNSARIKYVYQEHGGVARARNLGLKNAAGDFIVFVDSDDIIKDDCLAFEMKVFEQNPHLDVVYGDFVLIDEQGRETGVLEHYDYPTKQKLIAALVWHNPIPNAGTLTRKKCYEELGGFDPYFNELAEDYEFSVRAAAKYRFKYVPYRGYFWRIHPSNLTGARGNSHYNAEVLRRMIAEYSLKELFPYINWSGLSPEESTARAYFDLGKIFAARKASEDSINYLQQGLKLLKDAEAYNCLGQVYLKQNKRTEAERAYQEAIKVDQNYLPAWSNFCELDHNKAVRYLFVNRIFKVRVMVRVLLKWILLQIVNLRKI